MSSRVNYSDFIEKREAARVAEKNRLKRRYVTDALLFVPLLAEDVFGLIDADKINIAGVININLIWQALLVGVTIYLYWSSLLIKDRETKVSRLQGALIFALVPLCFVAAWRCDVLTEQPFVRGILPQRGFMLACLAAIFLRRPFKAGLIDADRFVNGIIILGSIAASLYLLQSMLGSSITLVHAGTGSRYGGSRYYVNSALSTSAGILSFWIYLRNKKGRYAIAPLLGLGVYLFVTKGRLELATYVAVLLFIFLFERASLSIKSVVACALGLALVFASTTSYFDKLLNSYFNIETGSSEDTSGIRQRSRDWYDLMLSSAEFGTLLGCGYPSDLYKPAAQMAGFYYGFLISDNGVPAYRYVYGDLGVVVLAGALLMYVYRAMKGCGHHMRIVLIAYILFLVIPMQNLAWWWQQSDWQIVTAYFVGFAWITPEEAQRIGACDEVC